MFTLDSIAKSLLLITNEYVVVGIVGLGYLSGKRGLFARLLLLLLFTMQFNPFLKALFEVPLHPSLNKEGFGLPSGHFQSAAVLWIWFAWESGSLRCALGVAGLLVGVGWALVYMQYHYAVDVWVALGFALLTCFLYELIFRTFVRQRARLFLLSLSVWAITAPMFVWTFRHLPYPTYLWLSQGALLGFVFGWWISCRRWGIRELVPFAYGRLVFGVLGIACLYVLFSFLRPFMSISIWLFLQYGMIAFWIIAGTDLFSQSSKESF